MNRMVLLALSGSLFDNELKVPEFSDACGADGGDPGTTGGGEPKKRGTHTMGAIARVLSEAGLEEYLEVRQVGVTRNYSIRPVLQTGVQTPWSQLNDWDRIQTLVKAVEALDAAGYGFPEEVKADGTVLPAESVSETFRLTRAPNRTLAPQIFVNAQRFDRDAARAQARLRRALAEGSDEVKENIKAMAAELDEPEAVPEGDANI